MKHTKLLLGLIGSCVVWIGCGSDSGSANTSSSAGASGEAGRGTAGTGDAGAGDAGAGDAGGATDVVDTESGGASRGGKGNAGAAGIGTGGAGKGGAGGTTATGGHTHAGGVSPKGGAASGGVGGGTQPRTGGAAGSEGSQGGRAGSGGGKTAGAAGRAEVARGGVAGGDSDVGGSAGSADGGTSGTAGSDTSNVGGAAGGTDPGAGGRNSGGMSGIGGAAGSGGMSGIGGAAGSSGVAGSSGSCGIDCNAMPNVAVGVCFEGGCAVGQCAEGASDVDGLPSNGCETPVTTSCVGTVDCAGICNGAGVRDCLGVCGGLAQPQCDGRECGPDGCGGTCAPGCPLGDSCTQEGLCCAPNCVGRVCGDDGCGGVCGTEECSEGLFCNEARGVCLTTEVEWLSVTGGTFIMGQDGLDPGYGPPHVVTVPDYQMTRAEITANQYAQCVDAGGCEGSEPDANSGNYGKVGFEHHPVNAIQWEQARAYCAWIGGRLPTEAEWEYAARNGSAQTTFPWGEGLSCDYAVMAIGLAPTSRSGCGMLGTWQVCSKPRGLSSHGFCDLSGNVAEWTEDDWSRYDVDGDGVIDTPIDGSANVFEPRSASRTVRGGHYGSQGMYGEELAPLRSYARYSAEAAVSSYPSPTVGFRCAR